MDLVDHLDVNKNTTTTTLKKKGGGREKCYPVLTGGLGGATSFGPPIFLVATSLFYDQPLALYIIRKSLNNKNVSPGRFSDTIGDNIFYKFSNFGFRDNLQ